MTIAHMNPNVMLFISVHSCFALILFGVAPFHPRDAFSMHFNLSRNISSIPFLKPLDGGEDSTVPMHQSDSSPAVLSVCPLSACRVAGEESISPFPPSRASFERRSKAVRGKEGARVFSNLSIPPKNIFLDI
ncbi:hypothetical protein SUGI_0659900 [Cryptomeria japonica]|nr:hypothetical protein SUGI_0659900 [Cryptomeria japonica]